MSLSSINVYIVDINECEAIPHLCTGGDCVNSIGSFTCECPAGQSRNPQTNRCDDKNECEDENICQDGRCINTDGSYYCLCNPGFIQSQDKKYCIGISLNYVRNLCIYTPDWYYLQTEDRDYVILYGQSKDIAEIAYI